MFFTCRCMKGKKRRAITKKEGTKIVIDPSLPQIIEVLKYSNILVRKIQAEYFF